MFDKSMFMKKFAGKKKLDPNEKEAKLGVAKELSKQAGAMLGDKAKPKKESAPDNAKEGLKQGLQDGDAKLEHSAGTDSVAEHSGTSLEEHDASEISPEEHKLSSEQLDEKIQKLMDLKASKEDGEDKPSGNPFADKEDKKKSLFS